MPIPVNNYSNALWNQYNSGRIPVIPDLKSRSPQEGDLLQGRDPVEIARILGDAGAPVLSVVTEPMHFGGTTELLQRIVRNTSLPVLRKDFINSSDQLRESVDLGASAVLLIASMLKKEQLFRLVEKAFKLGLEPLVETHNQAEINTMKDLQLSMIGINNRDIVNLEMDDGSVKTTEQLARLVNPGVLVLSESSISSPEEVERAIFAGAHAVLVGTAILQARDPAEMYRRLSIPRRTSL
ncbi:indole-3-glycerol phosphate synthase [hydrocarbon metagenome]|uniref:indole-3-glycerol-phosphate synthase n=1 Tax=hydrocarbon metagenome TaxID=938273 RepID=A0A0W8E636_9ZZZZ